MDRLKIKMEKRVQRKSPVPDSIIPVSQPKGKDTGRVGG